MSRNRIRIQTRRPILPFDQQKSVQDWYESFFDPYDDDLLYDDLTYDLRDDYFVRCIEFDHVSSVPWGSDLEYRCIEREREGYIDALPVRSNECPQCIQVSTAREYSQSDWFYR